jgi:sec-independent protein translocase protein TatB
MARSSWRAARWPPGPSTGASVDSSVVFNVTGVEVVLLLLVALIVLGPEKLPEAVRRFGRLYGELKRMSQGFQTELRDALEEPSRELRSTMQAARDLVEGPAKEVRSTAESMRKVATGKAAPSKPEPSKPAPPKVTEPEPPTVDEPSAPEETIPDELWDGQ